MDSNQTVEDFQIPVTANQPIYFSAGTGVGDDSFVQVPPFGPGFGIGGIGSLVCFAEDAGDTTQILYNHLYGNALIVSTVLGAVVTAVEYNAYSFRMENLAGGTATPGVLPLNGDNGYDACPQYLVENFLASDPAAPGSILGAYERPDLTLWPCKQDLRQDRQPTCSKAKFDVWNENEIKFTGAYQCFKCFLEVFLDELGATKVPGNGITWDAAQKGNGFGWDKFTEAALGTEVARMRVQGVASSVCKFRAPWDVCNGKTQATPLLGVLLYAQQFAGGSGVHDGNNQKIVLPITGTTLHGAGFDISGVIRWDPAGSTPEAAKR